jgi:hypothetical protein
MVPFSRRFLFKALGCGFSLVMAGHRVLALLQRLLIFVYSMSLAFIPSQWISAIAEIVASSIPTHSFFVLAGFLPRSIGQRRPSPLNA